MKIGLSIDMKIIHDLGNGSFQLGCMCGEKFTYIPSRHNWAMVAKDSFAKCPKCNATWTGEIKRGEKDYEFKLRHFAIMAVPKGVVKEGDETVKSMPIAVGTGIDMQHFALITLGRMNRGMLDGLEMIQISEVDEKRFAEIGAAIEMNSMFGAISLLKTFFGGPDDQSEGEDDSHRRKK